MSLAADSQGRTGLRSEVFAFGSLSVPIVMSYAGNQLLGLVDTAMVGRLNAASLAAVGIGNGIYFTISVTAMGVVLGMDPLVSQALGAGESDRARRVLWQAVRLSLYASLPCMLLALLVSAFSERLGLDSETARHIFHFVLGRLFNVVPFLLSFVGRTYLQAAGKPRAAVWATVWANVTNVVGNVLFIYGDDGLARLGLPRIGLPAMGVFGSGLASTLASAATLGVIARSVRSISGPPSPADLRHDKETIRAILRVGFPIGMHYLAEVGGFTLAGIFAGWLGPVVAAGNQVALSLASLSFTIAHGLSNATSVLVGRAVGRRDSAGARRAGFLGIVLAMVTMGCAGLLFATAPYLCARLLTNQADVLAVAVPLLRIAAVFQLADAAQAVAAGALRGAGDTRSAQKANMVGYYLVGLPLALLLGFGFQWGAPGIWWGLTAALFSISVVLTLKFHYLSKEEIHRLA